VRMAEIIPLEVVVRNFAAGELAERLGIPEGTPLPRPIVEYYLKDDRLKLPMVAEEHIVAFNWATQQDLDDIIALSLRVNDFLSGVMLGIGIRLADFRLEIGRVWDGDFMRLIVADEITPDSCRLWDMRPVVDRGDGLPLAEPGPLPDVYTELARRLGVLPSNVTHPMKPTLIN
jgi:phosphoribosylaminoimidazole-succinocarboxamide synthase